MRKSKMICSAAVIGMCVLLGSCSIVPDLSFAQEVLVRWDTGAGKEIRTVRITDRADVKEIAEACTKEAKPGSGDCGFNVYKLTFVGEGKNVVLRPAGDDCDTVQIGESEHDNAENMYLMGSENRKKLADLLLKYAVMMDYIEAE